MVFPGERVLGALLSCHIELFGCELRLPFIIGFFYRRHILNVSGVCVKDRDFLWLVGGIFLVQLHSSQEEMKSWMIIEVSLGAGFSEILLIFLEGGCGTSTTNHMRGVIAGAPKNFLHTEKIRNSAFWILVEDPCPILCCAYILDSVQYIRVFTGYYSHQTGEFCPGNDHENDINGI